MRQYTGLASWLLLAGLLGTGCVDTNLAAEPETATVQDLNYIPNTGDEAAAAEGEQVAILSPSASLFTGTCTTHKGNTVGWMDCTGFGTVRLIIDCKAPQISDYIGPWASFNGSITLSGSCTFGINLVKFESM